MYNAMSSQLSLLNVSSSSKFKELNLKDIEVLVEDKEQPLFKRTYAGRHVGITCIITSTIELAEDNLKSRPLLQAERGTRSTELLKKTFKTMISSHLPVLSTSS